VRHDAQLLAHLKNIRIDVAESLEEDSLLCPDCFSSQKEMEEYMMVMELLDNFYNKAEVLQKILTNESVQPKFEMICANILPYYDIMEKYYQREYHSQEELELDLDECSFSKIEDRVKKELYKLFASIYKEWRPKCLKKYPKNVILENEKESGIAGIVQGFIMTILQDPMFVDKLLLKLIDAKIAELEEQV
jgi:hypothetical protein